MIRAKAVNRQLKVKYVSYDLRDQAYIFQNQETMASVGVCQNHISILKFYRFL